MIGFHLGSATIGPALLLELANNLHLQTDNLSVMCLNTNRPNVHLVVHCMQHPLNSYEDLAFIIKKNLGPGDMPPPKFLVFFNSHGKAQAGSEYL